MNFNLSSFKRNFTSLTVGAIASINVLMPSFAAEKIFFVYSPLNFSLRVDSLAEFAQEGTVNKDLGGYFNLIRVSEEEKEVFRKALTTAN